MLYFNSNHIIISNNIFFLNKRYIKILFMYHIVKYIYINVQMYIYTFIIIKYIHIYIYYKYYILIIYFD